MHVANVKPKDYYQAELSALRSEALSFGEQHPELARELGLGARGAHDPQVELLMQSFAFLTGRLRFQIEQDKAALPNALLSFLYPHLEAPLPSMLIAEIKVKPGGANFAKEQTLARNRYISASTLNHLGHKLDCRFRTCYETPLLPLFVEKIEVQAAASHGFLENKADAHSVLTVRLHTDGVGQIQAQGIGPKRLRFYINNTEPNAYALYELLALHLSYITVQTADGQQTPKLLPSDALHWLGADQSEAMLHANPHTHPAYRLVQEYFAFPEKFLFFEISQLDQLDFSGAQDYVDVLLVLDTPLDPTLTFSAQTLKLNCVPLVNLFSQRIDPIALNHMQYEYHLKGDLENYRYCEIYAIEALESITQHGSPRPIVPYFAMDNFRRQEQQDYFYVTRRQNSQNSQIHGSELFISFLDQQFDLSQLVDEVVGGRAICTNRRLPEQLVSGNSMYLEGAGPVTRIAVLTKPTAHYTPPQIGQRPWALVSQLSLNHLSLSNGPRALAALKDILRLHLGTNPNAGHKQIDAIQKLESRAIMRHVGRDGWRGFVRGTEIKLYIDQAQFSGASPVLFCSVLRHFFTLYTSVNSIVEVQLETTDIKGKQWQPLAGAKIVL